VELNNNIG